MVILMTGYAGDPDDHDLITYQGKDLCYRQQHRVQAPDPCSSFRQTVALGLSRIEHVICVQSHTVDHRRSTHSSQSRPRQLKYEMILVR